MHWVSMVMWDPEYSDSELRAVEASVESRDEFCPSTPLNWSADTAETLDHRPSPTKAT